MDANLFQDMVAFLPEKYFLSKALIKRTPITFVDYERTHYVLQYEEGIGGYFAWTRKVDQLFFKHYAPHQEYGILQISLFNDSIVFWFSEKLPKIILKIAPQYEKYHKIFSEYLSAYERFKSNKAAHTKNILESVD